MPRGWEGNCRSGVALAMRHGLRWFIHLRAQRPRVGDEHPTYAPAGAWLPLPMVPKVRGSQGIQKYHGAKVNKDAEKKQNYCTHTAYSSSKFFLLASLADYLYFYFFICSAALV